MCACVYTHVCYAVAILMNDVTLHLQPVNFLGLTNGIDKVADWNWLVTFCIGASFIGLDSNLSLNKICVQRWDLPMWICRTKVLWFSYTTIIRF